MAGAGCLLPNPAEPIGPLEPASAAFGDGDVALSTPSTMSTRVGVGRRPAPRRPTAGTSVPGPWRPLRGAWPTVPGSPVRDASTPPYLAEGRIRRVEALPY